MRKLLLLFVAVFLSMAASAQLHVKENSFKQIPGFVNNHAEYQTDDNEVPFSVIVIKLSNITDQQARQLEFRGDMQTYFEIEYKKGEVWLYTSWYASYIKISHPDFSSVEFQLPFDMAKGKGYEIVLENKSSTLQEGYASISIITRPEDGAYVTLNGTVMSSTTPYKNPRIHSGRYTITVSKEFYRSVTQTVDIEANENKIIEIDMPLDAAYITFKADNETKVYVDDELLSTGGWTGRMIAGAYSVRYEKDKHKSVTKTIVVKPGQDMDVELNLTPITGTVIINSDPRGAQITIDGVRQGKTPNTINQMLIGEHSLTLEKNNYYTINKRFTVYENQTTNINENMKRSKSFSHTMHSIRDAFTDNGYEKFYLGVEIDQNQYNKFAFGVNIGFKVWDFLGIYGSFTARNLLKKHGNADATKTCDKDFLIDGHYPMYTGTTVVQQWGGHFGIILNNDRALSYRIGTGFREFSVYYETNETMQVESTSTSNGQTTTTTETVNMWVYNKDLSYKCWEITAGIQLYTGDYDSGLLWKIDLVYGLDGVFAIKYGISIAN